VSPSLSDAAAASTAREFAILHPRTNFIAEQLNNPVVGAAFDAIDMYELERTDLTRYLGLAVPGLVDQIHLARHADQIRAFLDAGRVLIFSGMLFQPWLPGGGAYHPKTIHSYKDYFLHVVTPHPIFDGITMDDLIFRRGVAGFFARGHNEPPPGAEILLALAGNEPVVYIDRVSTRGTILCHSGNDLLGYGKSEDTTNQLVPQLLAWMRAEALARTARVQAAATLAEVTA
jgi:hypothetical protein